LVAGDPPIVTVTPAEKRPPVIVTGVPPLTDPLLGLTAVTAVVIDLALHGYAGTVGWTRGTPDDWVTHASLNAIGVGVILHVGIGRRWPFGRPAPADESAVEAAEQGLRRA